MQRAMRPVLGTVLAAFLLVTASGPALAQSVDMSGTGDRPSGLAMMGDILIARPFLLASTLIGTAAFVVSLPFTLPGDNVGEAARTLVLVPAKSTFARCLGCTPAQDDRNRAARRSEMSEEK